MAERRRTSERSFLYKGHELEPGEEVAWCSSPKSSDDNLVMGQLVLTNRRLLFEPLRAPSAAGMRRRRWAANIDQLQDVEIVRRSRPWPTRGILRVTLTDGEQADFQLSAGGLLSFPISKHEPALQEAYRQVRGALTG